MMQSQAFGLSCPIHDDALNPTSPFDLPSFLFPVPESFLASPRFAQFQFDASMVEFEASEPILNSNQIGEIYDCLGLTVTSEETGIFGFPSMQSLSEMEHGWSPGSSLRTDEQSCSVDVSCDSATLTLPSEGMEIGDVLGLHHLLQAYGEAMECGQSELVGVLARRIGEKANPLGAVHERLAFHLSRDCDGEGAYLDQESRKNFEEALAAFYQVYPYSRFAHLTANCAILESIPPGTRTVHIVDFDLGEGIQWAPMIESIGRSCGRVKLTRVISEVEGSNPHQHDIERTERLLLDHSRMSGLNLIVERVRIEQLADMLRGTIQAGEWTVFNCMFGLPHTGRDISRRTAVDFMRVAVEFLSDPANYYGNRRGILVLGEGSPSGVAPGDSLSFGEFFEKFLNHYRALLESMETESLARFPEARITMESLFVSPFVSAQQWLQRWEEVRNGLGAELIENCPVLDSLPISRSNLMEARELIQGMSCYDVKIAEKDNVMVLQYRGNPMVRVSTWDCRPQRL